MPEPGRGHGCRADPMGVAIGRVAAAARSTEGAGGPVDPAWRRRTAALLREAFFGIVRALECDVLIECGARAAETSIRFLEEGGRRAIALEANPYPFIERTAKATEHGVDARNLGVGRAAGVLDLRIPWSSTSLTSGFASLMPRIGGEDYASIPVEITTLDAIGATVSASARIAVWVDVEGSTFEVLAGGEGLLERDGCQVLFVEVEEQPFWEGQRLAADVDEHLCLAGYVPNMRDAEYEHQHNVKYVRAAALPAVDEHVAGFWSALMAV